MLRVPAVATVLIVLALGVYWASGYIGARHKLAAIDTGDGPGSYRIELDFAPERFHQVMLQEEGRLVEVRGDTVYMKDVAPGALRTIARQYWVRSVERWDGK